MIGRIGPLIAVIVATVRIDSAQGVTTRPMVPRPTEPYVQKACPFEGCQYGTWFAEDSLPAYASEGDTTRIAFVIAPGETITAHKGRVHVERIGRIAVLAPSRGFERGDTVLVLGYEGEGSYPVWYEGRRISVEKFWFIPPSLCAPDDSGWDDAADDSTRAVMVAAPVVDWWVSVSNVTGQNGWLRLRNRTNYGFSISERIHGMDALE